MFMSLATEHLLCAEPEVLQMNEVAPALKEPTSLVWARITEQQIEEKAADLQPLAGAPRTFSQQR